MSDHPDSLRTMEHSGTHYRNAAGIWVPVSHASPLPVISGATGTSFLAEARAFAALQAAGAWDPAPLTHLDPLGHMYASILVRYERNDNAGGWDIMVERGEEDPANPGNYHWAMVLLLDRSAGIAAGAQTVVPGQSELYQYVNEGGDENRLVDMKIFRADLLRVNIRESGAPANPGDAQIIVRFSSE